MGLCSKCFKENQSKTAEADATSGNSMKSNLSTSDLTKAFEKVAASSTSGKETVSDSEPKASKDKEKDDAEAAVAEEKIEIDNPAATTEAECEAKESGSVDDGPSASNGTSNKRDITEVQDSDRPVQKNKKRCFSCQIKLELAVREIGRCKCDYVFCQLHRLPEQHDCRFDHKEDGRQQAKEKMISPKKHAGTSIKRMDSSS